MGFQADMAHSVLYLLRTNRPPERIVSAEFDWSDYEDLTEELRTLTAALRPWTIDFHVAQTDGAVYESGSHDNTGRHCHASDSNDWENRPNDSNQYSKITSLPHQVNYRQQTDVHSEICADVPSPE